MGNVVGGRPVLYNNQPVEILMDLVTTSLKNGEAVWFGCEVSKRFAGKQGIEDLAIHDFKLVFGVDIQITMSKGDRLLYGESAMTHAMTFTAVSCDVCKPLYSILLEFCYFQYVFKMPFFVDFQNRTMAQPSNSVWKIHGVKIVARRDTSP